MLVLILTLMLLMMTLMLLLMLMMIMRLLSQAHHEDPSHPPRTVTVRLCGHTASALAS
jgi:hypothetical protein